MSGTQSGYFLNDELEAQREVALSEVPQNVFGPEPAPVLSEISGTDHVHSHLLTRLWPVGVCAKPWAEAHVSSSSRKVGEGG